PQAVVGGQQRVGGGAGDGHRLADHEAARPLLEGDVADVEGGQRGPGRQGGQGDEGAVIGGGEAQPGPRAAGERDGADNGQRREGAAAGVEGADVADAAERGVAGEAAVVDVVDRRGGADGGEVGADGGAAGAQGHGLQRGGDGGGAGYGADGGAAVVGGRLE